MTAKARRDTPRWRVPNEQARPSTWRGGAVRSSEFRESAAGRRSPTAGTHILNRPAEPETGEPCGALLSYNIHKGIGGRDRRYRLDRIIQVIQAEDPDFICLQEVDRHLARSRHDDQPRKLSEALERDGAPVPEQRAAQERRIRKSRAFALAVSRVSQQISLRRKRRKPRGAQMAVVETPEGPIHLVNWHLGLAERERHWQVRHLLDHALFRESAHLPTLIAGDFNDWLNTLARGPVRFARFRAGDRAANPVPLIPRLLAGRFARQDVRARSVRDSPRPDRAHPACSRSL